jgi:hypothetical protein
MDTVLQALSGSLLDTLWTGLDHQPDITLHTWPPEVAGDPCYRGFHPHMTGHGSAVGKVKCFSVEAFGQQVSLSLSSQGLSCDGQTAAFV